jgi:hypothetical protein
MREQRRSNRQIAPSTKLQALDFMLRESDQIAICGATSNTNAAQSMHNTPPVKSGKTKLTQ